MIFIRIQLWVSTDLGATWTKIGDNVPANRYYWRRLDADVEGDLSKVYFEMRTTKDGMLAPPD